MYVKDVMVQNQVGLHARPATFFIQKANELPEANRFLVDRLYETAWRTIFVFKYGCDPEDIPAPWYDKKGGTEE